MSIPVQTKEEIIERRPKGVNVAVEVKKSSHAPQLERTLKLWHLIVYGIIIIQPTAPMGIYGVVSNIASGYVVTTILIAMVAMLFQKGESPALPGRQ